MFPASTEVIPKPELKYHPDFEKKNQGDFILQSDDGSPCCFYFPSALLCALSSFFSGLPPPSPSDLVDGCPFIPLQDTSTSALALALAALRSLSKAQPFSLEYREYSRKFPSPKSSTFIEAAAFGKRYDLPILYRLLLEGSTIIKGDDALFLDFAIWSISDVLGKLSEIAAASIKLDISAASKTTVSAIRIHAPEPWYKLQAFHLRRANAVRRFHKAVKTIPEAGVSCGACERDLRDVVAGIKEEYLKTKLIKDVTAVKTDDFDSFDSDCDDCVEKVVNRFEPLMTWFKAFTENWHCDEPYTPSASRKFHTPYY